MRFTAMNRGQSGKMAMAAAALSIGLLGLTGCGYVNAQQTSHQYAASDGTRADVGPVQLRNMLIVSANEYKYVPTSRPTSAPRRPSPAAQATSTRCC